MNFTEEEAGLAFFFHTETSLQRQRDLGESLGWAEGTAASVLVLDLQGMGKRHLAPRGLSLIAGLFATAQKVYVENVSRIFVVNTPKFFEVAFAVIRPVLDKRTVAKITILPGARPPCLPVRIPPASTRRILHGTAVAYRHPSPCKLPTVYTLRILYKETAEQTAAPRCWRG
jgi:hypothetical protein